MAAKKPKLASYAEQLADAERKTQGSIGTLPSAEAIQLAQHRKALQQYVAGTNTKTFCVQQAVIASGGKDWGTNSIVVLAKNLYEFMQDDQDTINPPVPE